MDDTKIAAKVAQDALDIAKNLEFLLDTVPTARPALELSRLYQVVRRLAAYATGREQLQAPVATYLEMLNPLWRTASGQSTPIDGTDPNKEPRSDLGVVVAGALARERLKHRVPLTIAQAGILAGHSLSEVRRLIRRGLLSTHSTAEGIRVAPEDVEALLRSIAFASQSSSH